MSVHDVTYLELLQLVKAGKAPKIVTFEGKDYKFTGMNYGNINNGYLVNRIVLLYSEVTLANKKLISYRDEILDDAERVYLRSVIKPFGKQVVCITKVATNINSKATGKPTEYIKVYYREIGNDGKTHDYLDFPLFECGSMYKGMEPFKSYTPEDLGL